MTSRIIIPERLWNGLLAHLLKDKFEHAGYLLCNVHSGSTTSFVVKELSLVPDSRLARSYSLEIPLDILLDVRNQAFKKGLALVEVHSHPFADEEVSFSGFDLEELQIHGPYMAEDMRTAYGALVLGRKSIDGLWWDSKFNRSPIHYAEVVGGHTRFYRSNRQSSVRNGITQLEGRYGRQILAFGQETQVALGEILVCIIGLGGIGSDLCQKLAYLGVRNFILVDPDNADWTSLNRLIGASIDDVGKPKVDIAKRMIEGIAKGEPLSLESVHGNLFSSRAIEKAISSDVIFGCVDNDAARLALNHMAKAFNLPYIDCATGIESEKGRILQAGGRVAVVLPDGPCLLCMNEVDVAVASSELSSQEERELAKSRGYISGEEIPAPSVVSLNSVVASLAVNEFQKLVTGYTAPKALSCYYLIEGTIPSTSPRTNPSCIHCGLAGDGDKSGIIRYTKDCQTLEVSERPP